MIVLNTSKENINKALDFVNKRYDNNIKIIDMRPINQAGTSYKLRLSVHNSRGKGGRLSAQGNGRHVCAACWHVHGVFFDVLLVQGAKIRVATQKIDKPADNWTDRDIGSMMRPMMFSEACECDY